MIPADRLNPAGLAFMKLFQSPNTTPSSGCNNYTAAVDAPVKWSQFHGRVDWSISTNTRLMVRYTQDSWKADNTILWGDSGTSVVGSNWDQPGRSLVAQLNQNIGSQMTNTLTFSYSANEITATRAGDSAVVDEVNALIPTFYPTSLKQRGGAAQTQFRGVGSYAQLWNQSPWINNQDLYVVKDDFSAVFGKHFVKAGVFYSSNAKNEEVNNTSQEAVRFGSAIGFMTPAGYQAGLTSGNTLADILLKGAVFDTNEDINNPNVQQRWHDLEFYLADSYKFSPRWTFDFGVRLSHMQPPFMADDRMGNFVLASVDPALGNAPCNGVEYPPGTNPCPGLGLAGGSDGPNRSLVPTKTLWFAPRLGVAWDVYGDGKMAVRAGLGRFYQRDRVSPGLGVGTTPPFSGTATVNRTLDSPTPVDGNAPSPYGAPSNALEQEEANSNYWQWNVAVEREILKNTVAEVAYVGSKGLDLFGQTNLNEVAPENRLAYAQTGNAGAPPAQRRRRYRQQQPGALAAQPRLDLPRAAGRGRHPVRTRVAGLPRVHLVEAHLEHRRDERRRPGLERQQRVHRQQAAGAGPCARRQRPNARVQRQHRAGAAQARGQAGRREAHPRRLAAQLDHPGRHRLPDHRLPGQHPRPERDGQRGRGHGLRRKPEAERRRGRLLHARRLGPDALSEPRSLDAQRLPDRHERQQRDATPARARACSWWTRRSTRTST